MTSLHEIPQSIPIVGEQGAPPSRLAAWLQFPRRLVLLLLAWAVSGVVIAALVSALLGTMSQVPSAPEWTTSWTQKRPVAVIVAERLPNTLLLVGVALGLALVLALVLALLAALVHTLESRAGLLGSVCKGLGRLASFVLAALPGWGLGVVLVYLVAFRWQLLPAVGMSTAGEAATLADTLRHLVLPAVALAAFPAVATAQAVAREVTLPHTCGGLRLCLLGLLRALGTLLGQAGGIVGAAIVVEAGFAWPGLGWTVVQGLLQQDPPIVLGALATLITWILLGRIAAEFFRWLERLLRGDIVVSELPSSPWRQRARKVYVVLALVLLLVPLGLVAAGLFTDANAVIAVDANSRNLGPVAGHPWGTDMLGRDIQARVLHGAMVSLTAAVIAGLGAALVGGIFGALSGFLASRRTLLAESLADVLLWPADVLLFLPAVATTLILAKLFDTPVSGASSVNWIPVLGAVALALVPRVVRAAQTLWQGRAAEHKGALLDGMVALLLGSVWAGLGLVATVDYVGLGIQPPTPALGGLLRDGMQLLRSNPIALLAPGLVLWVCATALYFAADALVGYFQDKGVTARLKE